MTGEKWFELSPFLSPLRLRKDHKKCCLPEASSDADDITYYEG